MKKLIFAITAISMVNGLFAQTETYDAIGIGITPSYPLHIYERSGESTSLMIDADTDANPNIYFKSNGQAVANFRYYDSGNDHFQIQVGSSLIPAINLSMDGKVGIGNIVPSHALDINGDMFVKNKIFGNSFTIDLDGGDPLSPKRITSEQVGGSASMELQTYSTSSDRLQTRFLLRGRGGNDIEFYDKDENKFVHFDGDTRSVGIGTANTFGYDLAVNGTIGAREVNVEFSSAWPDFVFTDQYNLMDLFEVETYIKENNHLPDVPSANEVEENGLNLGEMDSKLLQKIEELTLYMIEIKKEVKSLKNENSELKEKVKELEAAR